MLYVAERVGYGVTADALVESRWVRLLMLCGPVIPAVIAAVACLLANPACATVVEPAHGIGADQADDVQTANSAPEQPPTTADWQGIRRDTLYFLGYQAVVVGVLYALPEEETRFDKGDAGFSKWRRNVRHPAWDDDEFYLNYLLHPYWGATYYIRGRERGLSRWQSLGYSAFLSALYEFGAEAFFEPVSYQDLIVTPLVGSLLGEYVFSPLRDSIRSKPGGPSSLDKLLLILTDPMGAINEVTDRLFGVETQVFLAPMATVRPFAPPSRHPVASPAPYRGSHHLESARLRNVTWGLQLEVRW